ncbi:hypothetical protein GCM10007108_15530 [Thermogymnomonas acidicola]|uniref:Histidine phosphatase family protein n=1 Tax=Thermogymnomonas acidicola TaxID=399579 RepID=A0AA37BU97_9ARCH|nr:hypothetical protein GCM10007108_15530 [Thermogymnomonas acidicola]
MSVKLILLRHGQTDQNRSDRWQGVQDPDLNEVGLRQAELASAALRKYGISRILSSPLKRAKQTAAIVAREAGLTVREDPRLVERNLGPFEGLTTHEILRITGLRSFSITSREIDAYAGVEKWSQVVERSRSFIGSVSVLDGVTLAVTHGGFMQAAVDILLGDGHSPVRFGNCGYLYVHTVDSLVLEHEVVRLEEYVH